MPRSRPYSIRTEQAAGRQPPPEPAELSPSQFARRERIVQAGLTLMLSHDYESIQIRDVAESAGVAVGTVYRYFASKEHLFTAVFSAWQARVGQRFVSTALQGVTSNERLQAVAFRAIDAFEREPNFYKLMVMSARTGDPYARRIAEVNELNSQLISAEPLLGMDYPDRRIVVHMIAAVLEMTIGRWLAGTMTIDEVRGEMARIIELLRLPE